MEFVGRTFELNYLDRLYAEPRGSLCVIYGRRRVGKTRLLTQWLESRGWPGFYWLATDSVATILLRSLSQVLYRQGHGRPSSQANFSYFDWDELFRELTDLAQLAKRENQPKTVIILDEFTYAIEAYPDLPHKLQAVWDHHLKNLPIMLVLAGSHIGMMEEGILAHRSPLYARATGSLKLGPLPFKDIRTLFPGYDVQTCVALYSIFGGVPYYLEHLDPKLSLVDNMIERVIGSATLIQDEPRFLLHDHFTQPRLYAAIIAQIAQGFRTPKEIAQTLDLEAATVSKYLHTLVRLGLVQRDVPVTERHPERSRRSRYVLADAYLRFYYRFLAPQLPFIIRGAYQAVWQTIERHWRAFVGTHTFEELCREWIYVATELGRLPFLPQQVGSHWSQTEQIDVVALNWDEAKVLYGECKWKRDDPLNLGEVDKLIQRSEQINLTTRSGRSFERYYIFFSRSGFTTPAQKRAEAVKAMLIDLTSLDEVLAEAKR